MANTRSAQLLPSDVRDRLVELRRAIHREPELAFEERETARKLDAALRAFGIVDIKRVGATGLVARVAGKDRRRPPVAIRGDIDALPITEETGLPFASRRNGVMHACGHDVHATWAVGAAALLKAKPAPHDVLIVLQPAEEVGRGATAILESGALDDVAVIFGGHVDRRFEVGQVVSDPGPLAASTDNFEVEFVGKGAHAARPHEARDPIVCAAEFVTAAQTIVARKLNPATPGVVTIGKFTAGTAPNIIPDRATLSGTVRAVEATSRKIMVDELQRLAHSITAAHGLTANVTWRDGTPPLVNAAEAAGWGREAASRVLGADAVVPLGFLNLAGEDFAFYLERMTGCFLRIGAREPGGAQIAAHSPGFYPAEESIFVGAAVLAECARVARPRVVTKEKAAKKATNRKRKG